jgi:LmbE family N-acetylglucosaminyl deacetylase
MDLRDAAVVVAHPDDEVLWFSSLVAKVGRIVMCYGPSPKVAERGEQRRRVVRAYPYNSVRFLDIPEPATWRGRSLGSVESELARDAQEDPALRNALISGLGEVLRDIPIVFVHNPWGEYGHDDHRRLYAAVSALQQQLNFKVYVSSYVERSALGLMAAALQNGMSDVIAFSVDRAEIDPIVASYKANSCWTWAASWRWPSTEHFFRLGADGAICANPLPFQLFDRRA